MDYRVVREITVDEVLSNFIANECEKNKSDHWQQLQLELRGLPPVKARARIQAFAELHKNGSPIFPWTIGYRGSKRHLEITRWVYAEVDLAQVYSCGINSSMKEDLDKVGGNLKDFVPFAAKYSEFRLSDPPPPDRLQVMYGVAVVKPERRGKIELIDGAHRTVSMLRHGIATAKGYIAELGKR